MYHDIRTIAGHGLNALTTYPSIARKILDWGTKQENLRLSPCKLLVSSHLYNAPGHRTRMTSVKDRKRYLLRARQPGRRDPIHVASFYAQCGNTIPR